MPPLALTREQRAVVESDAHALAVHAGAGTGKTLTLAHRVARCAGRDPRAQARTLVVTFTRDATASLQRKLTLLLGRDHLVRVLSFHQWAARELPPGERRFLEEREARAIVERLLRRGDRVARAFGTDEERVTRALAFLGYVKNAERSVPDAVARGPFASLAACEAELVALQEAYEEAKGGALDYDDVPLALRDRLRGSPRERARVAAALDHIFVDEYQDVNGAQAESVHLLTAARSGPRVTVVGDARQSIYGFRGGSPEHLVRFHEPYGRRACVLALTANFRAARRLVAAANVVEPGLFPMRAAPRARLGLAPRFEACRDAGEEARRAADWAQNLLARSDVDAAEVAFLVRARFLAQAFHDELRRRGVDRVQARTIHAAKGLEWDHVWLLGAREGGLPSDQALRVADEQARGALLAEERRLLYVAMTRARRSFVASWAGRPSRFLAPLLATPVILAKQR